MKGTLLVGIGGAGCSLAQNIGKSLGVDVIAISADAETPEHNEFRHKLLLEGEASQARLPTGELTEVAVDSVSKEFRRLIADKRMVILAVGLGGNTGSGAAPVLARFAQEEGLEVVALVTLPFEYEAKRRPVADAAMAQLEEEGIELIIHDHSVESRRGQAKNESFNDYLNGVVDSFSGKVDVLL